MVKIKSPQATNPLRDLEGDKCFWISNGPIVKNLYELQKVLKIIDEEKFSYHVNEEKNDFYNWIKYSVQDNILADRIAGLKTKQEIITAIKERISELKPKVQRKTEIKVKVKGTKKAQKIVIKKPEEQVFKKIEMPFSHVIGSKPTVIGTAIAVIVMFAVVGLVSLSKAVITGASITDIGSEASPIVGIVILAVIVLVVAIKKIKRR